MASPSWDTLALPCLALPYLAFRSVFGILNTSVTKVNLGENEEIGDEGAKALAEALKVNTTVKTLYLSTCGIGDDGAAALAEALRSNTSLTELKLYCNDGIGEQGKQLLRDAVAGRQGFYFTLYV